MLPTGPATPPGIEDGRVLRSRRAGELWRLDLEAPAVASRARPGQFAMIGVSPDASAAKTLPRPMALYDWDTDEGSVSIVYRVVGAGTSILSRAKPGDTLSLLGPLGRPFDVHGLEGTVLLLGRGIGSCSLLSVAKAASSSGCCVVAVLSARNESAMVASEDFLDAGARVVLAVVDRDGSSRIEHLEARLRALDEVDRLGHVYCCGAERFWPLAGRLAERAPVEIQVAVEARMACGLGYCHGCAAPVTTYEEAPLVCRDGPCFGWVPDGPRRSTHHCEPHAQDGQP